ncbi:filamentous hemagglutinin N-terminal domain-containing protein, partial [Simiduia aestuariiviva]|nr:filamentous hemagglutinin family protein [Simiduia aestuariiviva]
MKTSIARKVLAKAISFHSLVMGGVFTSMVGYSAITCAGPTGGNIVGGDGEISTDDKTTRVDQISDVMAINWDTFNLAADEKVLYVQPSASSLVLNRILDDNASVIRGTIDANGHVLLVNPQGVLFTDSATVNVNGIAVSGLDIDPNDFMNGDFKLRAVDGASGSVINYGVINASSAALFGKQIANHGLIKADVVSLVGAGEAVLSFDSDGMIGVQITQSVLEKEAGVDSAVLNAGGIEGRQVLLDASVAKGLFDSAVNNSGTVTARGIDTSGGVIRLTGVGSQVTAGGTLDANGVAGAVYIEGDVTHVTGDVTANNAAGLGGQVHLLGEEVNVVAGAVVSADGSEGGGSVLVGGDYRGAGDVRLAQTTKVEEGAVVSASATADGDGGTVIVWAEDTAVVAGRVSANAAGTTGDGGFVETSGKNIVNLTGEVEALSAGGAAGTWLIDPGYLEIGEGASGENYVNANDLSDTLKNQSVTVISNAGNDFEGVNNAFGIRVTADLIVGGGSDTTLTLIAEGGDANNPAPEEQPAGIVIDADIRRINNKKFSLALVSNKDITITTGHEVDLNGGDLTANSLGSFVNQGHIEAGHVNLSVGQAGDGSSNTLGSVIFSELNITGGAGSDSFDLSSLANLNVDISAASEVMLTQSGQGLGFEGVESATTNGALLSIASSLDSAMIDFSLVPLGNGTAPKASIKSGADQIIELIGLSAISGENLTVSDTTVAGEDAELSISDSVGKKLGHNKLVFKSGSPTPFNLSVNGVVAIAAGRRFTLSAEDDTLNIDDQDTSNADDDIFSTETGIEFGASAFSEIDFGEGYDEVTRSNLTLALTGGHNNIAVGGILFTQVEKVKTNVTSFVGSEDADVVTMSNRKDFTANGIEIDGDNNFTTIDLANGADADAVDVVYGESGHSWTLLADGGARSRDIQFNNVEQVVTDDNNLSVEAGMVNVLVSASSFSDADFGGNSIVVNGLGFQRRNSGGVTDFDAVSVDETSSLLVDGDSFGTVELYDANSGHLRVFSTELENVAGVSGGELITTANTDFNFVITNDNAFTVSGISFTDVSSVTANGADDSSTSDMGWTLLGGANNAESRGVEFSGLERASGASDLLTGSALADMFALHADGTITGNGIAFTGIALVNAGDDVDSVQSHSDTAWTSTGDNSANAVTGGAIAFSQIEFVTDIASGATLFGQVGVGDTASDLTNDSITLNSIVFSNEGNFGALDLAGGGDSLTIASDVTSEVIGDNSVDVSNLVYDISGVDAIIGGQVTTLADSAVVVALDNLGGFELNGIAFSNSVKVTSQHDDSTIVGGDAWSFVGDSTSVIQTFTDMAFERFIG